MPVDIDSIIRECRAAVEKRRDLVGLANAFVSATTPHTQYIIYLELCLSARASKELPTDVRDAFFRYVTKLPDSPAKTCLLGRAYQDGVGIPKSLATAISHYSSLSSYFFSSITLASMLLKGEGLPKNLRKASTLMTPFSSPPYKMYADITLACILAENKEDLATARRLLETAANQYIPIAQYNLALMHLFGDGGSINYVEARVQLASAARKGSLKAVLLLADLLASNKCPPQDLHGARKLYQLAAESNDGQAAMRLAEMEWNAQGGAEDLDSARRHLEQAYMARYPLAGTQLHLALTTLARTQNLKGGIPELLANELMAGTLRCIPVALPFKTEIKHFLLRTDCANRKEKLTLAAELAYHYVTRSPPPTTDDILNHASLSPLVKWMAIKTGRQHAWLSSDKRLPEVIFDVLQACDPNHELLKRPRFIAARAAQIQPFYAEHDSAERGHELLELLPPPPRSPSSLTPT